MGYVRISSGNEKQILKGNNLFRLLLSIFYLIKMSFKGKDVVNVNKSSALSLILGDVLK